MKFDANTYFTVLAFIFPFAILAIDWFVQYTGIKSRKLKREEYNESFNKVIDNLSSDNPSAQLSAAVLLRRFFAVKVGGNKFLKTETVNVISSILRTVPIGIYQKTLVDGLAFAGDLTNADLQRTNLQNARIENKTEKVILDKIEEY